MSALTLSTSPHSIMAHSRPPCHDVTSETNVWSEFHESRTGRVGVFSACVCVCVEPAAEAFLSSGSQDESEDQSKVIVGVVVGLLIAAGLMGLIYWLYMKNSRWDQDSRFYI